MTTVQDLVSKVESLGFDNCVQYTVYGLTIVQN